MKRKTNKVLKGLTTLLILLFIGFVTKAQDIQTQNELYGEQAEAAVPGSNFVKLGKNTHVPSWVVFKDESEIPKSSFFNWFKSSFHLDPHLNFTLINSTQDEKGNVHERFSVQYENVEVDLNWLMVHSNKEKVYSFNGNVTGMKSVNINPILSENQALRSALAIIDAEMYLWEIPFEEESIKRRFNDMEATYYPQGELVLVLSNTLTNQNEYILVWKFSIQTTNPDKNQEIFINASNGDKVKSYPLSYQCNVGSVSSTWYGTKSINTDQNGDGDYILLDDCSGPDIHTTKSNGTDYANSDNTWTAAGETGPATSHLHGIVTMDYFSTIHSRNSFNGSGGNIEIRHIAAANAYYSGGGLIRVGEHSTDANYYNTLDVVAHEFTHGVIDFEANLTYQGESGALNESFADILGETCEMWYEGLPSSSWDWLHREDYFAGTGRSFINPKDEGDPDTYNGTNWKNTCVGCSDAGGVHSNSGVQNYWFYVLTVGASGTNDNGDDYSVTGLGLVKARTISYDNLTDQLGASSDYSDARTGAIAAAVALYGSCSNEVKQVTNAWYAVGVGNAYVDVSILSSSNVSCNGAADGSITISTSGTAPFTYAWSDGPVTQNRSGLSGGTYTVTVTDATGCTAVTSAELLEPETLVASAIGLFLNGFNISCNGLSDGEAIASAVGGTPYYFYGFHYYTYQWDANTGNQVTENATGLSAGNYSVTVTDANGCTAIGNVTLTEPPLLSASISSVSNYNGFNISCNGGSDGWANVTASGGVSPYSYLWDVNTGNQVTENATGLSAGNYSVTVTDANGCTAIDNITLTEPTPLTIDAGLNQTVYFGYPPTECATIAWSGEGGGVAPYTIIWSDAGGQSHQVCPGINTTVYTVLITDANGCQETDEVMICVIDVRCGKNLDKVELCHVPFNDPWNTQTICVGVNAVSDHLSHGDMLAACGADHNCPTAAKTELSSMENTIIDTRFIVFPNPFSRSTTVKFYSVSEGEISIVLYDNLGRRTKVLYDGEATAGIEQEILFNDDGMANGMYSIILTHSDGTQKVQKIILSK